MFYYILLHYFIAYYLILSYLILSYIILYYFIIYYNIIYIIYIWNILYYTCDDIWLIDENRTDQQIRFVGWGLHIGCREPRGAGLAAGEHGGSGVCLGGGFLFTGAFHGWKSGGKWWGNAGAW